MLKNSKEGFDNKNVLKKYIIPYKNEIEELLINNHDNNNHSGRDSTIFSIKKNNYYWINMKEDVKIILINAKNVQNIIALKMV